MTRTGVSAEGCIRVEAFESFATSPRNGERGSQHVLKELFVELRRRTWNSYKSISRSDGREVLFPLVLRAHRVWSSLA